MNGLMTTILLRYPQTKKSLFMPLNPQAVGIGGATSGDYANRNGAQINAVKQLLFSLNSAPSLNKSNGSNND